MYWIIFFSIVLTVLISYKILKDTSLNIAPVYLAIMVVLVFSATLIVGAVSKKSEDLMILNGQVTGKSKVKVSCSHSYSCMCVTINKVQTCQTCYEHNHDFDWRVYSTVGGTEIERVDSQGVKEPPRFTKVIVGEPFSITKTYKNYIKGSPHSVFKDYGAFKDVEVPSFPKVYDYYRVSHVIDWNSEYKSGIRSIDKMLSDRLATASMKAKANVIIVFYSGSPDLIQALKVKNFGGRTNDLVIGLNLDKDGNIRHVSSFSWSKNAIVDVKMRDIILDLKQINVMNQKILVDKIEYVLVKYYQRRDNEEFKYLEANKEIPTWFYIVLILTDASVLGLCYLAKCKEI